MLRMRRVYVEGFEVGQVWQQARRVLDAAGEEVVRDLPEEDWEDERLEDVDGAELGKPRKSVRFEDDGLEIGSSDAELDDDEEDLGEEGVDYEVEGEDDTEDMDADKNDQMADGISDEGSLDIGDETLPSDISEEEASQKPTKLAKEPTLVKDKFGLNDGFFSIDDFNKQSQFLEQADARGQDDGAASDEEDIDWTVDPSSSTLQPAPQGKEEPSKNKRSGASKGGEGEEMSDGDEDVEGGPTFGNMELNAPEGDSDMDDYDDDDLNDQADGMGLSNTNDIMYKDFFEPPATSKRKTPRRSKLSAADPSRLATEDDATSDGRDAQTQRAISSIQRDLFDDDLSSEDDPDLDREPQDSSLASNRNLSTHERRQLVLREEIRKLEAANVAPKSWDLAGETLAPTRPENSLLEADLEFDRAGKPVPIITDSVNEDIEALIKRRILNREFDEVIRRRPTDLVTGQAQRRRGLVELPDTKFSKGLAEEYEDEHLRKTDPNYMDQRSEALKAKHADIEKHWRAISGQLEALCNLHYKPRPAQENLEVRVDAPRITMEEARPSVAGAGGEESVLAPQELYKAGQEGKTRGETMARGGTAVAKEEESREQKKRRKRREKERMRKAGGNAGSGAIAAKAANDKAGGKGKGKRDENENVVRQLGKGGVKVIDKKGELKDVQGQAIRENGAAGGAGRYKL